MGKKAVCAALAACVLCAGVSAKRMPPDPALAGPRPDNYEELVRAYLMTMLRDPDSVQLKEIRGPRVGTHKALFGGYEHDPHWWVCYLINAKNAFGAYVGYHKAMFAIAKGKVWDSDETLVDAAEHGIDNAVDRECSLPIDAKDGTPQ